MTIALTSPVTGAAQTGLTSPTYTLIADIAPDINGKQHIVSALGGTQAGVTAHSVGSPFTITAWRPRVLKAPVYSSSTDYLKNNPSNVWKLITRKGMLPASGEQVHIGSVTSSFSIPAGAETFNVAEMRAMLSAHIGALSQLSASLGDSFNNGTL